MEASVDRWEKWVHSNNDSTYKGFCEAKIFWDFVWIVFSIYLKYELYFSHPYITFQMGTFFLIIWLFYNSHNPQRIVMLHLHFILYQENQS